MKYYLPAALVGLRPGSEWTCVGNDYSGLTWLSDPADKPTELEVNNKLAELDAAEPVRLLREERDTRLTEVDWMVVKYISRNETIPTELSDYMQELRDLPDTASPALDSNYELDLESITWPTKPQL